MLWARIVPAAGIALAVGLVAELVALSGEVWEPWEVAVDAAPGVVSVLAGAAAWRLRPNSHTGPALVAIGGVWFLGAFGYGDDEVLVDLVGFPLSGWFDVLLLALLLAATPGGLRTRSARLLLGGAFASHLALSLTRALLRPPNDFTSCLCVPNRITGITDPGAYETAARAASVGEAAFAVAVVVLLAVRWRRSGPAARRVLGLLLVAGVATATVVTYNRVVTRVLSAPVEPGEVMTVVLAAIRISVPIAILVSLVRGRRARAGVADVLVGLDRSGLDEGLGSARRALADPGLQLLRWEQEPEPGRFVDADGRPAELPKPAHARSAAVLERDGVRLGALVHDAALREEPELLEAVAAAARLALHNERLTAQARASLHEVEASRRRIVQAADSERRRIERNLHDGAQQHLLGLALRLRMLQRQAAGGGNLALADDLDAVAAEIEATLTEIRALARGLRPPVLSEAGLQVALEELSDRLGLAVEVDVRVRSSLPEVVEATVYYLVSEALTNVLKHAGGARASVRIVEEEGRLLLSVHDDGCGGARQAVGGGLLGLGDRVAALGGSFELSSPPGAGTTLVAALPLAAQVRADQRR